MENTPTSRRFSISGLMAVVGVVALGSGAMRELVSRRILGGMESELVVCGALPMGVILGLGLVALLFGGRGRLGEGRPGLVGFEVFGVAAWLLFLAACFLVTRWLHQGVEDVLLPMGVPMGPVFLVAAVVLLLLPQLAVAFLGAWLGRRNRVKLIIERRSGPIPESTTEEHDAQGA